MSIYISTLRKKMADKFGIILEYRQGLFKKIPLEVFGAV